MTTKTPARQEYIDDFIERKAREDGSYAIAYALRKLDDACDRIVTQLHRIDHTISCIGSGDNSHAVGTVTSALHELTHAVSELKSG
jgi:hypothetical protein